MTGKSCLFFFFNENAYVVEKHDAVAGQANLDALRGSFKFITCCVACISFPA